MAYIASADVPAGSTAASLASIVALARDAYSIKSVADATARAQAVTDWPTLTGAAAGVNNPVIVYRQDLGQLELTVNGAVWQQYIPTTGWTNFTPTIKQGSTVLTTSTLSARYIAIGKLVHLTVYAVLSSAGSAGTVISLTAPAGAVPTGDPVPAGSFNYFDSGVAHYSGMAIYAPASGFIGQGYGQSSAMGAAPSFTAASGDRIYMQATYEIA